MSPNDLRRTFGTWLRLHGVAPHFIGVAVATGVIKHHFRQITGAPGASFSNGAWC